MNFTVISPFKNYTPTHFTFINFYKSIWDVKNFIFIIGYNTPQDKEFILKNYITNYSLKKNISCNNYNFLNNVELYYKNEDNVSYTFFLYKTINDNNQMNNWHIIKNFFYSLILSNANKNFYYISVDDDEFIYSKDISSLKNKIKDNKILRFHFVESYPGNTYKDIKWCLQAWYIHRCSVDDNKRYNCGACKTYIFNLNCKTNHNLNLGFWYHSGDSLLENSECYKIKNGNYNILEFNDLCYHVTGLTIKNLKYTKFFNRYITDINNAKDGKDGNYVNFDKYYNDIPNHYKIFTDDTILKYIDNRDIELLRE